MDGTRNMTVGGPLIDGETPFLKESPDTLFILLHYKGKSFFQLLFIPNIVETFSTPAEIPQEHVYIS